MTVIVGIAGGTGSGKTSLAAKIRDRVGEDRCLLIAQDSYYKDGSSLTPAAQAATRLKQNNSDALNLPSSWDFLPGAADIAQWDLEKLVLSREKVIAALGGREPDRIIHVDGGKLVNLVVR